MYSIDDQREKPRSKVFYEHGDVLKVYMHGLRHFADCTVMVGKPKGCLHSGRILCGKRCQMLIKLEKWHCAMCTVF